MDENTLPELTGQKDWSTDETAASVGVEFGGNGKVEPIDDGHLQQVGEAGDHYDAYGSSDYMT